MHKFDIQLFAGTAFSTEVGSNILPATTALKIAWTGELPFYVVGQEAYTREDIFSTTSGYFQLETLYDDDYSGSRYEVVYTVNASETNLHYEYNQDACGDSNNQSCGTYKYFMLDTSVWTESQRTITYVNDAVSTYGITYEDLNPVSTWTVTFDSNDGTAVSDIEDVEDGATIELSEPADPTRENYTFAGWYKEEALTNAWVFASDTVTADTTLYAKWVQGAFEKMQEFGRQIVERVNGKASKYPSTNTQDANYTLVLADDGKLILAGHATNAVKVTIPLNATVEFPTNTEIAIVKYLAGDVTIGTASGATLNGEASTTTFEITDQYGSVAIKKIGTDAWIMTGAFEEVV